MGSRLLSVVCRVCVWLRIVGLFAVVGCWLLAVGCWLFVCLLFGVCCLLAV